MASAEKLTNRYPQREVITVRIRQEPDVKKIGRLTVLCAPLYGGAVELTHTREIWIGTDPNECGLIAQGTGISRKHCCLSYNAKSDTYLLMDISANGTYLADGRRLPKNLLMELEPGMEFWLSEPENRFRVG